MASPLFALSPSALILLLLLLVDADIGVAGATRVSPNKKVAVQVLYESLCPDSIRFIKDQLAPTFEALGSQRMVVEFVPYGKATTMRTDSGFDFRCQHGHSECRGNKLQACALARLLADNKRQVKFVTCVMSLTNPSRPSEKCIGEAGLQMEDLRTCVSGREGEVLLAGMGEKTPSDISFVPQVLLNGEAEDQDQMLSNLMHMVCNHLAPTDRPSACERKKHTSWFFWG